MKSETKQLLAIGGFDSSGGAGLLADVKTAESNGVYAYAVCTGITFQHSRRISRINWLSPGDIREQIALCSEDAYFHWIKLGMMKNPEMMEVILNIVDDIFPNSNILWDPILSSSSGYPFMRGLSAPVFERLLSRLYMVTPNLPEFMQLYPHADPTDECKRLSMQSLIYLKGGHDQEFPGRDRLFIQGHCYLLPPGRGRLRPKHGSGCVLSTALTARLALKAGKASPAAKGALKQDQLLQAAAESKRYTENFLGSAPGLLGWHQRLPELAQASNPPRRSIPDECLQFLTADDPWQTPIQQVQRACKAGLGWIQLRMKDTSKAQILENALAARKICDQYGALLIINDHVDIALQAKADGVHLGLADMPIAEARRKAPQLLIGATANDPERALQALRDGADYLGIGPFRFTSTKKKLAPLLGAGGIREILNQLHRKGYYPPIFAIGGIRLEDLSELSVLKIQGIAVSGLIHQAKDPAGLIRTIQHHFNKEPYHVEHSR